MLAEKSAKVSGLRRQFTILYIIAALACVLAATVVSLAFISVLGTDEAEPDSAAPDTEDTVPDTENNTGNTNNKPTTPTPGGSDNENNNNTDNTDKPVTPEGQVLWLTEPGTHLGSLILVNEEYDCDPIKYTTQSGDLRIVAVKANRTTGNTNLWAIDDNVKLCYSFIDALCKMTDELVAAGITERHLMVYEGFNSTSSVQESKTGLSVVLRMILDGQSYQLDGADSESAAVYQWILANSYKFGIIHRYSAEKAGITGQAHNSRRFRYVGEVHAKYMQEKGFCLEEYLESVKPYNFNKRLDITVDGADYSLYYVKAGEYENGIPVPKDTVYEISGDNMGGYVVLIHK